MGRARPFRQQAETGQSGHGRQNAEGRSDSRIENGVSLKIIVALVRGLLVMPLAISADNAASNFPAEASACTPKVQARLRAEVSKLAGHRRPKAARELVSTFLCGESLNAEQFIAKASAKVVIDKIALNYITSSNGEYRGTITKAQAATLVDGNKYFTFNNEHSGSAAWREAAKSQPSTRRHQACSS